MANAEEALFAKTPLGAPLDEGARTISLDQKVTFTAYYRLILPLDGYAFWVRSDLVSTAARYNAVRFNAARGNQPGHAEPEGPTLIARGSLHVASDSRQEEDSSYTVNRVVFTSLQEVQPFNDVGPGKIYIAEFDGIRFAFSSRASFYKQAGLWHYVGNALYSTMESQIIDDLRGFSTRELIVSNSLPAWLALNQYNPPWPVPLPMPAIPLYPSYLVPDNLPPPFGAVHVEPNETTAIQAAPIYDPSLSQRQLVRDRIVLTLWGCSNMTAQTVLSAILQYSYDTSVFGVTNMPAIRDDKKTQNELLILAEKKRIIFDVSYYQTAIRSVARQLILDCVPSFYFGDKPLPLTET